MLTRPNCLEALLFSYDGLVRAVVIRNSRMAQKSETRGIFLGRVHICTSRENGLIFRGRRVNAKPT